MSTDFSGLSQVNYDMKPHVITIYLKKTQKVLEEQQELKAALPFLIFIEKLDIIIQ